MIIEDERCQTRTISLPEGLWRYIDWITANSGFKYRSEFLRKYFQKVWKEELKDFHKPNRPLQDLPDF